MLAWLEMVPGPLLSISSVSICLPWWSHTITWSYIPSIGRWFLYVCPQPQYPSRTQDTNSQYLLENSTWMSNKFLKISMVKRKFLMPHERKKKKTSLILFLISINETTIYFSLLIIWKTFWLCFKIFSKSEPFLITCMNTTLVQVTKFFLEY